MLTARALSYEIETHADMSQAALQASALNQSSSKVLSDLGLEESINVDRQFPDSNGTQSSITQLFRTGARFEDSGIRPRNHFYNPLNNTPLTIPGIPLLNFTSPDWVLEDNGQITGVLGQNFSFADARGYLLKALTLSSESDRQKNFGSTFQTLGQVVHHIQDMAQPQHVRNDPHWDQFSLLGLNPLFNPSSYEKWTDRDTVRGALPFSGYAPTYSAADRTTFNVARNFWHTPTADLGRVGKGLADFTNRSFVSAGTNFDRPGLFPTPDFNDVTSTSGEIQQLCAGAQPACPNLSLTGTMFFFGNTVVDLYTGALANNPRASTLSVFDADLQKAGKPYIFTLNRFNFTAAHSFLIPRAVGYSAGMINYFFRGKVDYVPDPDNPGGFLIKNLGTEPMKGKFQVYYDDTTGTRHPVEDTLWDTEVILASAATPGVLAPGEGMSVPGIVPPVLPAPKTLGEYILVFSGEMGEEKAENGSVGAVVGKAIQNPYTGAIYLAGLDANGQLLSLRMDKSGLKVLRGFDISKQDANNPNGVFVPGSTFDPLSSLYLGSTNIVREKIYSYKQADYGPDPTAYQVKSVTFNSPDFPQTTWSYFGQGLATRKLNEVVWAAGSPNDPLGTFEFHLVNISPDGHSASVLFTRRFKDASNTPQTATGIFPLPTLAFHSYGQFYLPSFPLVISDDGLSIAGFVRTVGTDRVHTRVKIALGVTPQATAEETTFSATSSGIIPSLFSPPITFGPICSLTFAAEPDGHPETITSTTQIRLGTNQYTAFFAEPVPIGNIRGSVVTYTHGNSDSTVQVINESACNTLTARDYDPATDTFSPIKIVIHQQGNNDLQSLVDSFYVFDDGRLSQAFSTSPRIDVISSVPVFSFPNFGLFCYCNWSRDYSGFAPAPEMPITVHQSFRDFAQQTLVRALTNLRSDAIYTESLSESQPFLVKFRGVDITGKQYVADSSPLGEVFFAATDLSVFFHDPVAGAMPKLTRDQIPANMVKVLAVIWL